MLDRRPSAPEAGADRPVNSRGMTKRNTIVEVPGAAWPHQHRRSRVGQQSTSVGANPVSSNQRVREAAIFVHKWLHCFIPDAHTEAEPAANLPVVLRISESGGLAEHCIGNISRPVRFFHITDQEIRKAVPRCGRRSARNNGGRSVESKYAVRTLVAGLVVPVAPDLDSELKRMRATRQRNVVRCLYDRVIRHSRIPFRVAAKVAETKTGNTPSCRRNVRKTRNPELFANILLKGPMRS